MLDGDLQEMQEPLFKLSMISNALAACEVHTLTGLEAPVLNPLTKIWQIFDKNRALIANLSEYKKLVEIEMIHVLGPVEDERCFSSLTFLKDKLEN